MDRTFPGAAAVSSVLPRMPALGRRGIVWLALAFNCALWYGGIVAFRHLLGA